MRGVQCFMPVNTGRLSSPPRAGCVSSGITFSGLGSSTPSARYRAPRASPRPVPAGRAPVEPEDGSVQLGVEMGRAGPEVDRRHVDGLEDARAVGRYELRVVGRRKRADPGVAELDRVCAGGDLLAHVAREAFAQRL